MLDHNKNNKKKHTYEWQSLFSGSLFCFEITIRYCFNYANSIQIVHLKLYWLRSRIVFGFNECCVSPYVCASLLMQNCAPNIQLQLDHFGCYFN